MLCADLYDSGIVVMDSHEDYYFVDSSLKKDLYRLQSTQNRKREFDGCDATVGKLVYEREMKRRKKQEGTGVGAMHEKSEAGHVELYQAGKKWGVKIDGKVIVPPLYCSIAQPVGAYCAFEQVPRHWGVRH